MNRQQRIQHEAFQRLPYAQASAVPFFEPYVATKDSLEELMVKKREGAKELDGNMASIKKAQAVLVEQLAANNREQARLEQRYAFLELNVVGLVTRITFFFLFYIFQY